jgi:hypothetical protein
MRKRVSARRWLAPGKASNYFTYDNIKPGDLVVLACRVSGWEQERTKKLNRQVANLRKLVKARGARIAAIFKHVGSGQDPVWLGNAADEALENGAKIVVECVNRAIRHPAYHSKKNFTSQAQTIDLEDMKFWTKGLELVSILAPDATPQEERSYQTRRGQAESGNKGGRPRKQTRRLWQVATKRLAIDLHLQGTSYRKIAAETGVPVSTMQRWFADIERVYASGQS